MTSRHKPYGRRRLIGTALLTVAVTSLNSSATAMVAPPGEAITQPAAVATAAGATTDRTSALEARRVDSFPTPKIAWDECPGGGGTRERCATFPVPLDYDDPTGPTVNLAIIKLLSANPKRKIGTLFVNPGGPATSVAIALSADFYGKELGERFDIVGLEPRGVGYSDKVQCWKTFREQNAAERLSQLDGGSFPETRKEFDGVAAYTKLFSQACSKDVPLAGASSTAEYARDLDVARRAVGDKKLTYMGFSYGTVVGQTYAALFPDRVRAVVLDGVADAVSWYGTPKTANQPSHTRFGAGEAQYASWVELMKRCDKAGPKKCAWSDGNSLAKWKRFTDALKAKPLDTGPSYLPIKYSRLVFDVGSSIYATDARIDETINGLQNLYLLEQAREKASPALLRRAVASRKALAALASKGIGRPTSRSEARAGFPSNPLVSGAGAGFFYESQGDAYSTVWCTDALNPKPLSTWWKEIPANERRAPYFGVSWLFSGISCAGEAWTVQDEDIYRGPFNKKPATPMLAVGNTWDPATNYKNAISVARRTPGTGLLLSDSWGHTAWGTSECVTSAVTTYLVTQKAPPKGTRCVGDYQPFADPSIAAAKQLAAKRAGLGSSLPVVGLSPRQMP